MKEIIRVRDDICEELGINRDCMSEEEFMKAVLDNIKAMNLLIPEYHSLEQYLELIEKMSSFPIGDVEYFDKI